MRFFPAVLVGLALASSGCSTLGAMFGAVLKHGVSGSASSAPTVHCQSGPDGNPQCYEYKPGALRSGDPAPVGGDPYASVGESPNASAQPVGTAPSQAQVGPGPAWQAPMPLPPEPVPAIPGR